jgi:hypothetical protein
MGIISSSLSYSYRKVYKVSSLEDEKKYYAFKKITYGKDSDGVKITFLHLIFYSFLKPPLEKSEF